MNTIPSQYTHSAADRPDGQGYINYIKGPFAGKKVRTELYELQSAKIGRKFALIDRRPLDPPPVVEAKFYHLEANGRESELILSETDLTGFVCSVDLFTVPGSIEADPSSFHHGSSSSVSRMSSPQIHHTDDIVYVRGSPARSVKRLVGSTSTQPHRIDFEGRRLIFVFPDLSVQTDGEFILRYRVFDLYSLDADRHSCDAIIQAEVFGEPFRVYSTKEFPGLPPSTELTKAISRLGIRVNVRETERRRSKKSVESPPPPIS